MSKTIKTIILIVLAVSLISCGTVLALMLRRSQTEENSFVPAIVSCEVKETVVDNEKTSIKVKNTGNIEAYLRVCFVTYWVNAEGGIVPEPSKDISNLLLLCTGKWKARSDNIYYYVEPVAPGEEVEFLDSEKTIVIEEDEDGNKQVLEVFAEAIQSLPDTAVTNSWKVTLNGERNITAVR